MKKQAKREKPVAMLTIYGPGTFSKARAKAVADWLRALADLIQEKERLTDGRFTARHYR